MGLRLERVTESAYPGNLSRICPTIARAWSAIENPHADTSTTALAFAAIACEHAQPVPPSTAFGIALIPSLSVTSPKVQCSTASGRDAVNGFPAQPRQA